MAYRKWKETKVNPGTARPGNMLWCSLVSFHFLWAILCPQAVQYCDISYCNISYCNISYCHIVNSALDAKKNLAFVTLRIRYIGLSQHDQRNLCFMMIEGRRLNGFLGQSLNDRANPSDVI